MLLIIIVFLPIIAELIIRSTYSKYSEISNKNKLTGKDVAKKILEANGLSNVSIISVPGNLTDNYDPRNKVVSLSNDIYSSTSISSLSVAAHEVGHAIQDKEQYSFMRFRSAMVPVVNFTSRIASIFIIIGLFSEITNLLYIGIICLLAGLFFQFITLPVEFNASSRAKEQLTKLNLVSNDDLNGVKKVLNAAAFTYVASFLAMALQIFRLVMLSRRD